MFRNRADAGRRLAALLRERELHDPVVLAIPRGGVATGAELARVLGAELDVVLARKLRAPGLPELAVGAVSEDGHVYLSPLARELLDLSEGYLAEERRGQLAEVARGRQLFRGTRPRAPLAGRSVIVTDDGLATGSTMIAALQMIQAQDPREVIVAVPVGTPDRLEEVRRWCDDVVCPLCPDDFRAIGQFYQDFTPVGDAGVLDLLREATGPRSPDQVPTGQPVS
jgi:predicted phosphoribosyltransferase